MLLSNTIITNHEHMINIAAATVTVCCCPVVQLKHAACDFQLKHAPHDTLQLSCPRDNILLHAAQLPPFTSVLYTAVNMHPDSGIDGALQAQAADVHQFLRAAAPSSYSTRRQRPSHSRPRRAS